MDSQAEGTAVLGADVSSAMFMDATQEFPGVAGDVPEVSPEAPKGSRKGLVIALSCVLVVLIAAGGFLCFKLFSADDSDVVASNDAPSQSTAVQKNGEDATADTSTNPQSASGSTSTTVTPSSTPAPIETTTTSSNKYINANPSADYVLPNSSSSYVSESELSVLTEDQLRIARNEIAARHGRLFRDGDLQEYFNSKGWYSGTTSADFYDSNTSSILNGFETANSKTIKDYENAHGYN